VSAGADRVEITAPAKINLALHVTGRRGDGYHLLETLVVFADFGDRLEIGRSDRDSFAIAGPYGAGLSCGSDNLVIVARDRLRATEPRARAPLSIRLDKRLPVASGVGGGSSDAVAAMIGIDRLLGLSLTKERLVAAAAPLGADMAMCLAARPLIARGIGDEIEPVEGLPALPLVLVNPGVAMPTPAVFSRLAIRTNPPLPPLPAERSTEALLDWLRTTRNDLHAPAALVAPVIDEVLAALEREGAGLARMSGSGATCFGIFTSLPQARDAVAAISRRQPDWFAAVCLTGQRSMHHD